MARAALTVQEISRLGIEPSYAAAEGDGNSFNNTGSEFLHIKNGASDCVVTVQTPRTVDGQAVTPRTVTVTASEERMIGPFPPGIFNQAGALGDVVYVDYDDESNVTVGVFRI
ncbi:MAG: hypothetical protein P1V13_22190 [Rhizobiaceae bacterium]|nr:hypothetical protein [Rhizobiaceae bacterium]